MTKYNNHWYDEGLQAVDFWLFLIVLVVIVLVWKVGAA